LLPLPSSLLCSALVWRRGGLAAGAGGGWRLGATEQRHHQLLASASGEATEINGGEVTSFPPAALVLGSDPPSPLSDHLPSAGRKGGEGVPEEEYVRLLLPGAVQQASSPHSLLSVPL